MPADLGAPPGLSLPQEGWPMSAHAGAPPGLSMPADLGAPPGLSLPQCFNELALVTPPPELALPVDWLSLAKARQASSTASRSGITATGNPTATANLAKALEFSRPRMSGCGNAETMFTRPLREFAELYEHNALAGRSLQAAFPPFCFWCPSRVNIAGGQGVSEASSGYSSDEAEAV
eukprot:s16048_g1.t1